MLRFALLLLMSMILLGCGNKGSDDQLHGTSTRRAQFNPAQNK